MEKYKTQLGIQLEWRGNAENEKGIISAINKDFPLFHHSNIPDPWNVSSNIPSDPSFWSVSKRHPDVFDRDNIPSVSIGDTVISIDPNYYRPHVSSPARRPVLRSCFSNEGGSCFSNEGG